MSLTPIYDELRELHITETAGGTSGGVRRTSLRLAASASGGANVGQLAGRRGLGGRHRRPAE
ncbi:MAG: hypothetical protein J2P19_19200 [Pseudonocardia sp.]|nr:hypothetical protein [Pseudonocardia sp.]